MYSQLQNSNINCLFPPPQFKSPPPNQFNTSLNISFHSPPPVTNYSSPPPLRTSTPKSHVLDLPKISDTNTICKGNLEKEIAIYRRHLFQLQQDQVYEPKNPDYYSKQYKIDYVTQQIQLCEHRVATIQAFTNTNNAVVLTKYKYERYHLSTTIK